MVLRKNSAAGRAFDIFNHAFLGLLAAVTVAPLAYVLLGSISSTGMIGGFTAFSLDSYRFVFTTDILARSAFNSVFITLVGTALNISVTAMTAYVLSKKSLRGRRFFLGTVVVFMLFNPGMIPNFLLVDTLGLTNTYWSLWLPTLISAFNLIVMKNFYIGLPESIDESAKIDGCNDLQVFLRIALPLSKSSLATFSLFYAVSHWNSYFHALLYIRDAGMWPIQMWLRQIVILSLGGFANNENLSEFATVPPESVKYTVIIISTIPIVLVYPFLQRYFAKGVLLGSVKG
jgi:putative aldouronate transport system permease protein